MKTAVLIVAAGRGSRAGGGHNSIPKQYRALAGLPVLAHSLRTFGSIAAIDVIRVVLHPDDEPLYHACTAAGGHSLGQPIHGSATRQASVRLGLEALAKAAPDYVLIHDAARPMANRETIERVLSALTRHSGAIAAIPAVDTLKRASSTGTIAETVDRGGLWQAQTPQGFHFTPILDAHRKAAIAAHREFTDDAAIAEWAGIEVGLVMGSPANFKITTEADFARAERQMGALMSEVRTGTGFDVHRFTGGDHVWLCGVKIPHTHKLEGHSDADVGLHALTDAILGALGDGDIGQHFPPSDPQWKGAASKLFLADAARRVRERGGVITNVDLTLLCEAPRIGPHRDAMRAVIAEILGIEANRVGVKATTTEGLGFTGRREGIAAMATATLRIDNH